MGTDKRCMSQHFIEFLLPTVSRNILVLGYGHPHTIFVARQKTSSCVKTGGVGNTILNVINEPWEIKKQNDHWDTSGG